MLLNPYQPKEPIINDLHAKTGTLEGSALLLIAIARLLWTNSIYFLFFHPLNTKLHVFSREETRLHVFMSPPKHKFSESLSSFAAAAPFVCNCSLCSSSWQSLYTVHDMYCKPEVWLVSQHHIRRKTMRGTCEQRQHC